MFCRFRDSVICRDRFISAQNVFYCNDNTIIYEHAYDFNYLAIS